MAQDVKQAIYLPLRVALEGSTALDMDLSDGSFAKLDETIWGPLAEARKQGRLVTVHFKDGGSFELRDTSDAMALCVHKKHVTRLTLSAEPVDGVKYLGGNSGIVH